MNKRIKLNNPLNRVPWQLLLLLPLLTLLVTAELGRATQLTTVKSYKFEVKKNSNKTKLVGTLKLSDKKNAVFVEFEGTGLKKGKYKIVQIQDCAHLTRPTSRKKSAAAAAELYAFETEYGEISGENNLQNKQISQLSLDTTQVALIRAEKNHIVLISCGVH